MGCQNAKVVTPEIDADVLKFLKETTGYSEKEVKEWYRSFCLDCPDGKLSKSKFVEVYKTFFRQGTPEKYCAHVFRTFDTDNSGEIDFQEFIMAIRMATAKDPQEKLKWAFRMYDVNNDGEIDVEEMVKIVISLVEMSSGREPSEDPDEDPFIQSIVTRVHEVFDKIDANKDGKVTVDEFITVCTMDQELATLLCISP